MKSIKTFFYSFKKSLFDFNYYQEIKEVKFSFCFKYLWFLFFILTFFSSFFLIGNYITARPEIKATISKIINFADDFYPEKLEMKIKNGELSTNVKEPYVLKKTNSNSEKKNLIVIDTNGLIENYPDYNTYILLTKRALVYPSKTSEEKISQTSVFYFKNLKQDLTINKKNYDSFIKKIKPYAQKGIFFIDGLVIIMIVLFLIFAPLVRVMSTFFGLIFLTFILWLINLIFKKGLKYAEIFKIGIHASTLPIILIEIIQLIRPELNSIYSIIFLLWAGAIIFSFKEKNFFEQKKI
ncbi:MAG: DUF1189 domain-containing protein [Patescibacteria group bacterium]|nr:DUF1189 domain-containing protein [Patescibacteria group bacterium]